MKIKNINDKTTARELRKMLYELDSVHAQMLRHKLFEVRDQDAPADPDDIYAAKVIVFDELIAKKTEEKTKTFTPKELREKAERGELYIKTLEHDYWKPRGVDFVYEDYGCELQSTLHITWETFRAKWEYCNQDGSETYSINPV